MLSDIGHLLSDIDYSSDVDYSLFDADYLFSDVDYILFDYVLYTSYIFPFSFSLFRVHVFLFLFLLPRIHFPSLTLLPFSLSLHLFIVVFIRSCSLNFFLSFLVLRLLSILQFTYFLVFFLY